MSAILQVRHISKGFEQNPVLRDVSLDLDEGQVLVVVGPSGCGKSTLLRCINGLEQIDGGEILLRGEVISGRRKNLHLVRQKIGMVFQSYDLFPHMRVTDNLMLGLADKAGVFPRTLSGGQRQRVALVRAMLMQPEILLLDEITAALDPEMVSEVLNVVLDLARDGMTMVIVTHEMRFAEAVADQVVFLEDGCVVERNPPEVFFHHPETERAKRFLQSFDYTPRKRAVPPSDINTGEIQCSP